MAIYRLDDETPRIAPTAWVAEDAQVMGRVELQDGASVWFGSRSVPMSRSDTRSCCMAARSARAR